MKKFQVALIMAGVILTAILFSLPKTIVGGESKSSITTPASATRDIPSNSTQAEIEQIHSVEISPEQQTRLTELKKKLNSFREKEKKITFADSIAEIYRSGGIFDSVAEYSGLVASFEPSVKNLEKAGDAYYQAFSASAGENKALGMRSRGYFQQILDKNPANLEVKSKLAMTWVASESPMKGIGLLREILEQDPDNETALYNMGILSLQSGQNEKAVERFQHLLKVNPANANAQFYLGMAELNLGRKKEAEVAFNRAKKLEPDPAFQSVIDSYIKKTK